MHCIPLLLFILLCFNYLLYFTLLINVCFCFSFPLNKTAETLLVTYNETTEQTGTDALSIGEFDEDFVPDEITREVDQFENKPKPNLEETESINLGTSEDVRETRISVHLTSEERRAYIELLNEYRDIFA